MEETAEKEKTQTIELFEATCDACGQQIRSPFRHADAELVYCYDCILNGRALALTT